MEVAAEADDKLIEKFIGGEELTHEEMQRRLEGKVCARAPCAVLCGSATANIGIPYILKFLADYAPSPAERAGESPRIRQRIKTKNSPRAKTDHSPRSFSRPWRIHSSAS